MRRTSLNAYLRARPKRFRLLSGVAVVVAIAFFIPGKSVGDAPFAEEIGSLVQQYDRRTPTLASSGTINDSGYGRLSQIGFESVLDLRVPEEGTEDERLEVEARGMRYFNVPMGYAVPSEAEVAAFARIVEDENNLPLLFHGVFANRAGAMWALYRVHRGMAPEQAYEEGRTAGLKGRRAAAVREALGLE
jgi:protein tyrosine phosphatase (PTP) superfamily phosphohydrolase (DUF442 family)